MENNEIRQANRKALPRFILILLISMMVGGGIGFLAARYELNTLASAIKSAGAFFGARIAPWLMLAVALILPGICVPAYCSAAKWLRTWDGEDEETGGRIEKKLSFVSWLSGAMLILSYFLITAFYSGGFSAFEDEKSTVMFFITIASLFAVLAETTLIQQKCVDAMKRMNPEKRGSVYDFRFQKKWVDSCDEAERILIGKCAFRAYCATNLVCTVLSVVLALGALIFEIGFLPSMAVCLVWMVNQSTYCKAAMKYSKAGNKIS